MCRQASRHVCERVYPKQKDTYEFECNTIHAHTFPFKTHIAYPSTSKKQTNKKRKYTKRKYTIHNIYPSTGGGRSNSTLASAASVSELKSSMLPPPAGGREGEGEREGVGESID